MRFIHSLIVLPIVLSVHLSACAHKKKAESAGTAVVASDPTKVSIERWKGTLDVKTAQIELVVDFSQSNGKWEAFLHLPQHNLSNHPLNEVSYADDAFHFEIHKPNKMGNEIYEFQRKGDVATGKMTTGGGAHEFPITFNRDKSAAEKGAPILNRPQTPKGPFPYSSKDITFVNPTDKAVRVGTLTIPQGDGPHPVVIIESGSGAQDRNGTIFGHRMYHVLADHLSRKGVAVLRVDDRGLGESKGDASAGFELHAEDLVAGVNVLKAEPGIDPKRIGIMGHSQGASIGPMASLKTEDISFLVLLCGMGVGGDELMNKQKKDILVAQGVEGEMLEKRLSQQKNLLNAIKEEKSKDILKAILTDMIKLDLPNLKEEKLKNAVEQHLIGVSSVPMRDLVQYDPKKVLSQVKVPTFAVFGEKDIQVDPVVNEAGMKAIFEASGNKSAQTWIVPGMNHIFQPATTGQVEEYAKIETTAMPEFMDKVAAWIAEQK